MWQITNIEAIKVYHQRNGECRYEVHISDKLELIVRNRERCTVHYLRFENGSARDQCGKRYDDGEVENIVNSMPELSELPKDIVDTLQSVKKTAPQKPSGKLDEQI